VTVLRHLDLAVPDGCRTALVGPSGAGKTTLLRAVCGLEPLQAGTVSLGDRRVDDLPAHRRRCAVVFQEPRLLEHLDVVDNVAFALRAAGVRRAERRARARRLLSDVGLPGFEARGVAGLSGGEQQRVALARALCADPVLLLLDEPLASVDPNRRRDLRRLIVDLQEARGVTMLLVTHDRDEAAEIGQRVALMLEGRIVQHDEPRALYERPLSAAVARFFGAAVLRGEVRAGHLVTGAGSVPVPGPDGAGAVAVRPERVLLDPEGPLALTVHESVYAGTHTRLVMRAAGVTLEARCDPGDAPPAGARVRVALPFEHVWRLPVDDGAAVTV